MPWSPQIQAPSTFDLVEDCLRQNVVNCRDHISNLYNNAYSAKVCTDKPSSSRAETVEGWRTIYATGHCAVNSHIVACDGISSRHPMNEDILYQVLSSIDI